LPDLRQNILREHRHTLPSTPTPFARPQDFSILENCGRFEQVILPAIFPSRGRIFLSQKVGDGVTFITPVDSVPALGQEIVGSLSRKRAAAKNLMRGRPDAKG
jgi:hypothetical protein